jgi:hypothetical protein
MNRAAKPGWFRCPTMSSSVRYIFLIGAVSFAVAEESLPTTAELHSEYIQRIKPLLENYCIDCHDADEKSKTSLRLDTIAPEITAGNIEAWTIVKNRIDIGTMPPQKEKSRPARKETDQLLSWIGRSLNRYDSDQKETGGDTVIRRINNRSYANIIKTLLDVPPQGLEDFPEDGSVHGFDTVGTALYTTTYLYELYLKTAQATMDLAVSANDKPPAINEHKLHLSAGPGRVYEVIRKNLQNCIKDLRENPQLFASNDIRSIAGILSFYFPDVPVCLQGKVHRNLVSEVVLAHYGETSLESVAAKGIDWANDPKCASEIISAIEIQIKQLQEIEQYVADEKFVTVGPFDANGVGSLQPGYYVVSARLCLSNPGFPLPVGIIAGDRFIKSFMLYDAPDSPHTYEQKVFWDPRWNKVAALSLLPYNGNINSKTTAFAIGYLLNYIAAMYNLTPAQLSTAGGSWGLQSHYWTNLPASAGDGPKYNLPIGILCSDTSVRGPIYDTWPPPATTRIFTRGLKAPPTQDYAEEIVSTFMKRAYVVGSCDKDMIQPYVDMIMTHYNFDKNFVEAVKFAISAIISSPQFLYLDEHQRADHTKRQLLSGYELARRLAYFLWSDLPDDALLASAANGTLLNGKELLAQTRRMLKDDRNRSFRAAFTTQWLKIDKIERIVYSYDQFPAFDIYLQQSAKEESIAFFSELLEKNESVINFIDSDFLMLNGRMAQHYGIPGIVGNDFRRVQLSPGSHRGGVLTQASILMATSNGMVSSPVRRGAFVMDRLLGVSPGVPPRDVPALDVIKPPQGDDTPLTPTEKLALHRANQSCARCHDKIDPLGAGLENFNALGTWNSKVRVLLPEISKRTHSIWLDRDADVHGTMLDGVTYDGPDELKQRLLDHKDQFLRSLAENLMIYALGRDLEQSDRPVLDKLCADVAANGYGLSTLIEHIVLSDEFTNK